MKKQSFIYYLLETLFCVFIFCFLLFIKINYSVSVSADMSFFLVFAFILCGISLLTGPYANKFLVLILGNLISLYFITQTIYFRGFSQYYRFSTALSLMSELTGVKSSVNELLSYTDFLPMIFFTVICSIFIILTFVYQKRLKIKNYYRLISVVLFVFAFLIGHNAIKKIEDTQKDYVNFNIYQSDYYLYEKINSTVSFKNSFGLYTLFYRDAETFFEKSDDDSFYDDITSYFEKRNLKQTNNEVTGILKDKKIILTIQAESLINAAISEELTPTLYNMLKAGNDESFNTPLLIGSTSDTEFMANTSIIPATDGYSVVYECEHNKFTQTLGNLFKDNGYKTIAMHNNFAEYYNRDIMFDNYGYTFYDSYGLGVESMTEDSLLGEEIGWMMVSDTTKYFGYWITYSGHQPYSIGEVGASIENCDRVLSVYPDLKEPYVAMIAKAMDLDKAITDFINVMDWSGNYNNFAIILFGDHIAKSLDFSKGSDWEKSMVTNSEDNPSIVYTPFTIYCPSIEITKISKTATALDIMPTVANLMGFEYNPNLCFGKDIYSSDYKGFYFGENGYYYNTEFIYDYINNKYEYLNCNRKDADELIQDYLERRDICSKILKSDYFNE